METKRCIKCGKELPVELFSISKINKDGFYGGCKECLSEVAKQYYGNKVDKIKEKQRLYRVESRDKISERKRKHYSSNKDKISERDKIYYESNKDWIRERKIQYYESNKAEIKEQHKQYVKLHLLEYRMIDQKREAKKRSLSATLTKQQWDIIKAHFNNCCCYCGKNLPLAQDHFIPLSKSGDYSINNIVPACKPCNSSKRASLFDEWYPKYKFYNKKREKIILKFLNYKNKIQQLTLTI